MESVPARAGVMEELNARVAMWQTYVQTAESDSNRAESINRYMTVVQVAIFSGYFIVANLPDLMNMIVDGVGAMIGFIWLGLIYRHMQTHRTKLKVIVNMEQVLPFRPITQESAILKKAVSSQVQDATFWNSDFIRVQMIIVAMVTVIHLTAMTWFGWLSTLQVIYRSYGLSGQSNLPLWLSFSASVVGLVGLRLMYKFKDCPLDSSWFWQGLIMTVVGVISAITLIALDVYVLR